mgnify:FL=1|jgi:hypothetical protein
MSTITINSDIYQKAEKILITLWLKTVNNR